MDKRSREKKTVDRPRNYLNDFSNKTYNTIDLLFNKSYCTKCGGRGFIVYLGNRGETLTEECNECEN